MSCKRDPPITLLCMDLKWFLPLLALMDAFLLSGFLEAGGESALENGLQVLAPVVRELGAALLALLACALLHRVNRP
jgi:hypothetical protein